jgi:hypothetical protein
MRNQNRAPLTTLARLVLLGFVATSFGCAALSAMKAPDNTYIPSFEECPAILAEAFAHKDQNNDNDRLLYYTRLATIQQACRQFTESAANFESAKRLAEDLYTKSVRAEATSMMLNDAARPYAGENFERAFMRILNALNFAAVGDESSAMVEARQVDFFLRELDQKQGGNNVYNEDPFGRYLTGLLHENAGDVDSARISYMKALESYSNTKSIYGVGVPPSLLSSALAMAEQHSSKAMAEVSRYGSASARTLPDGAGEVVIVHQVGQVPDKVEEIISFAWGDGWATIQGYNTGEDNAELQQAMNIGMNLSTNRRFQVAFPLFLDRPYGVDRLRVTSPDIISVGAAELVSNVGAIAKKDLADRINRIRARTIGRAAVYFAIEEFARQQAETQQAGAGAAIGLLGALRTIFLEHADRRQWDGMPDKIKLIHVVLPTGSHSLRLDYLAGSGIHRTETLAVNVTAGRRSFLVLRTAR